MLSGIGPADHLREVGITPVVSLPVGMNLQDHLKGVLLWKRLAPRGPFHTFMRYDRVAVAMVQAYLLGTGPATELPLETQGYIKTSPELDVPDLEFMLRGSPIAAGPHFSRHHSGVYRCVGRRSGDLASGEPRHGATRIRRSARAGEDSVQLSLGTGGHREVAPRLQARARDGQCPGDGSVPRR